MVADHSSVRYRNTAGQYANYFKVGYNAVEFVIDYGQFFNGDDETALCGRIITSPSYVRCLIDTLSDAMIDFERKHGPESVFQGDGLYDE
jgi:hypothetical protein